MWLSALRRPARVTVERVKSPAVAVDRPLAAGRSRRSAWLRAAVAVELKITPPESQIIGKIFFAGGCAPLHPPPNPTSAPLPAAGGSRARWAFGTAVAVAVEPRQSRSRSRRTACEPRRNRKRNRRYGLRRAESWLTTLLQYNVESIGFLHRAIHVFSMSGAAGLFREAAGTEVVGLL